MISSSQLLHDLSQHIETIAQGEYTTKKERELIDIGFQISRIESRVLAVLGVVWASRCGDPEASQFSPKPFANQPTGK